MASKTRIVEIIRLQNGRYGWLLKARNGAVTGQHEGIGYGEKRAAYRNAAMTIDGFEGCRVKDLVYADRYANGRYPLGKNLSHDPNTPVPA